MSAITFAEVKQLLAIAQLNDQKCVLIGCEFSGIVRDTFAKLGHLAISCDLLPSDKPGYHYQGDVLDLLDLGWDLGIFHPPCTYLSSSGLHWNKNPNSERFGGLQTEEALAFVAKLLNAKKIHRKALENPVGCISTRIRPATQYIQPYDFGDDASKKTGLWLENLPPLTAPKSLRFPGRMVEWPKGSGKMVERWSNQTDSGQNKLGPSDDRWAERSETYAGIAAAMGRIWSRVLEEENIEL
jgi:hypothetical protein